MTEFIDSTDRVARKATAAAEATAAHGSDRLDAVSRFAAEWLVWWKVAACLGLFTETIAAGRPRDFFLFIFFFPTLVSGPISGAATSSHRSTSFVARTPP